MVFFGHYIPPLGLKNLHSYKYSSGGYTPLDKFMNPWWEFVASLIPSFIHPNTLTILGFISAICASVLQLYHTPTLSEEAPRWVYLAVAFLFFLYQTFDAIDGKHARRNKLSSPLGQLFDHGCDIILTTPLTLVSIAVITAGSGLLQEVIAMTSSQTLQFIYMWWELHFHVFYAATGIVGVTEAQLLVMGMAVMSGIFGPSIWRMNLLQFLPSSPVTEFLSSVASFFHTDFSGLFLVQAGLITCNLPLILYDVLTGIARASNRLSASAQISSFFCYMVLQGAVWHTCLQGPLKGHVAPGLVYLTLTTSYSILVLRLCLSATCRFPFKLGSSYPIVPFLLTGVGIVYSPWCQFYSSQLLWGVCIWNLVYLADFLYTSVADVCDSLGITCFRVDYTKVKVVQEEAGRKAKDHYEGKETRSSQGERVKTSLHHDQGVCEFKHRGHVHPLCRGCDGGVNLPSRSSRSSSSASLSTSTR
ncbi:cdp-alcohol phosphatidyltransferase superfamily protein [Cystoisospora suis]|uniref:Cdp-alcohol phosphatidyltransferase superfamily protein n=1 Tax=Cystoisospora suis TaxID=483139 RepID=A0A2C6KWE9_9APIC|nr:cdp-alcohol phosphatidyltransferase superfamily protein [Cystoisospora suis]